MVGLSFGFGLGLTSTRGSGAIPDNVPSAFTFTDQTNVAISTVIISDEVTIAGLGTGDTAGSAAVTITGGEYSKNSGAYASTATTAVNGDKFRVRHTSSASNSTATDTTLTIGGVSDTFTSTTIAAGAPELFPDPTLVSPNYTTSGLVTKASGQMAVYSAAISTSALTLNTTLLSAFNANIVNGTTYDVALTITGYTSGNIRVRIWNGTVIILTAPGNGVVTAVVTAGATSAAGLFISGDTSAPATLNITNISVKLH